MADQRDGEEDSGGGEEGDAVRGAQFIVERQDADVVVIADVGDHARILTVTNDAEGVVRRLHESGELGHRRLLYHDSEGSLDELKHDGAGTFVGFAPGPGRDDA